MKKIALLACCILHIIFQDKVEAKLKSVIDFNKIPSSQNGYFDEDVEESWKLGGYGFNFAPELTPLFGYLKRTFNIDTAIETGTFQGGTTIILSYLFDEVHTIEVDPMNYLASKKKFVSYPNVESHVGSSEQVLPTLLSDLKGRKILFYLDAHWNKYWPLLDELEIISQTHKNNCILVIDDFKVPGREDIPFDAYGKHECSFEYIKEKLSKVFSSYKIHYIIPRSVNSRAKLVVIPDMFSR